VVCTRPKQFNGIGKSVADADADLTQYLSFFRLVDDNSGILSNWRQLVTSIPVLGKKAHDARLVAAMMVHRVADILTFNTADFARFPSVAPLHPSAA
jgi:predicted nucleic acid-binding protein